MALNFSWADIIFLCFLLAGKFWWATLFLALFFWMMGLVTRGWWRRAFYTLAAVVLAYQVIWWAVAGFMWMKERRDAAEAERHQKSLLNVQREQRTVNGFLLPVGATVQWSDDARTSFSTVDLPGPTPELGVLLTGHTEIKGESYDWNVVGTLAQNSIVRGWPCAAGDVTLDSHGELMGCILSAPRHVHDFVVPMGTQYQWRYPGSEGIGPELIPPAARSIALPALGLVVPGLSTLQLHPDLTPRTIDLKYDSGKGGYETILVHGIALHGSVDVYYGRSLSQDEDLGKPATSLRSRVSGQLLCAGKIIEGNFRIYLKNSTVQAVDSSGDLEGSIYPVASCHEVPAPNQSQ